jgi:signal transduction histidine kinase
MLAEREVGAALSALARAFANTAGGRASVWVAKAEGSDDLELAACHGFPSAEADALRRATVDASFGSLARARESRVAQMSSGHATLGGPSIVAPLAGREGVHGLLCGHGEGHDLERTIAIATMLGTFGGMVLESVQLERRAEAMWEAASERLTDGIALLDRELRVVRMNSAETLLLGAGVHVLGKKCHEVFSICQGPRPCPHEVALTERLHLVRELPGGDRPFRVEIIPASPNAAGIAVIHVAHDLSDERAMRTRLLTADRLATIGRLSAGVAHEINNPAAFVTVNLGVLRDRFLAGTATSADVLSMVDESLNGMERIREIVRDLKGFARERSRDVVDLSQIAVSAIRIAAHETRGRARVDRALEDGVLARARGARIAQCVLNLLVNAAQAMPPESSHEVGRADARTGGERRIEVKTYKAGDRARLEVTDNGPGVPDPLKRRVFEPFFTTREAAGGTGLGLWLARGIVEEEDGTLTLEDAPEGGARFIVDLPAHEGDAPHDRNRESPDASAEVR